MKRKIKPQKVLLWKATSFLGRTQMFLVGFYRSIYYLENWLWLVLRGTAGDVRAFWENFNKLVFIEDGTIYEEEYDD